MSFTPDVYEQIRAGCKSSAATVVPVVHDLVKPETVVDVGGGEGWWAREFALLGCSAVVLDDTVEETRTVVADAGDRVTVWPGEVTYYKVKFGSTEPAPAVPVPPSGQYDLAVCLEVAEHLPAADAGPLVNFLCQLAPVVLWSAAIPNQGGHGHLNEQWPGYWHGLFDRCGYVACDYLREGFWADERVEPWYRQNMLLYGDPSTFAQIGMEIDVPRALVHPVIYGWRVEERDRLQEVLYP